MTDETLSIDHATLMTGFAFIGNQLNWPRLITGELDHYLKVVVFYTLNKKLPTIEELDSDNNLVGVSEFKNSIRARAQGMFNDLVREPSSFDLERAESSKKSSELHNIKKDMDNSNKPSPMGTVKELSKQFNVSMSYVRKLKRENRLDELK